MENELRHSFEQINYLLRPSKQVERKLFVEMFLKLAQVGYDVPSYTYVGLGSVYFADFLLFNKYLYIDNMICVEHADIPNRMKFNKRIFNLLKSLPAAKSQHAFQQQKRRKANQDC